MRGNKENRLEARCSPEVKQRIELAAELQGRSLADFLVSAADAEACQVIEQYQIARLSVTQSVALAEALLAPVEPNRKSVAAMRRYKQKRV